MDKEPQMVSAGEAVTQSLATKTASGLKSPTNSPNTQATNLGLKLSAEIQAQAQLHREKIKPRLQAKYGTVSDSFLTRLEELDSELQICETCKGNGTCPKPKRTFLKPVIHIEDGELFELRTECKHGQICRIRRQSKPAGIPNRYIGKGFSDYIETPATKTAVAIARWVAEEKPRKSVFFYGGVGTGKTMLASIVAQEFIRDWQSVIFGDVPSLLADIKATFGTGKTNELLQRLIETDLLVVDDIGAEKVTDWSAEQLYLIINGRYNNEKPVIVTSNYDFDGLIERLGADIIAKRITSRLNEMCVQAFFGTQDWRNSKFR